ncbi:uncharacterized protein LOC116249587 [Nymphaea colorata]|nr:uncharacterized protein LOC116249587 [Nymphaea colorata]
MKMASFLPIVLQFFCCISAIEAIPIFLPPPSLLQSKPSLKSNVSYKTHFFPQVLDHFTFVPQSYKLFQQKYLTNSEYWGGPSTKAPIFVYAGNEGKIEWFAENTGFMFDIAPKFRALLVFIEHRFYGESLPFGKDSSNSSATLGYLSSQQALADYATLILSLKKNLSAEDCPVVVFGGSYGGMLAAWFRLKYPHIVLGALSSSAPILQFDDLTPLTSFYDTVSKAYKDSSNNCFDVIKKSWDELILLGSEEEGLLKICRNFRACKTASSVYSVRNWLWEAFIYTTMVNYPMKANFLKPLPANPVKEMCRIIDSYPPEADTLTKVFAAASLYFNYSGTEKCFEFEKRRDPHGLSGWNWQACTEMVMPMSCSEQSMFPPDNYNYTEKAEGCMLEFGVQPRRHWITTEFGGHRIGMVLRRFGSNIIFSNGMLDPWSGGGVLKNISDRIVALVTEKGAHHLDLRFATKEDPDWLIEQRRQEVEIIQSWLDQYYLDLQR